MDVTMPDGTSCCASILDLAAPRIDGIDQLRRAAFHALRFGTPPRLSDLAAATGQDLASVRDAIGQLVTAGIATIDAGLDGDPTITGAEGLTVEPTPHRLLLAGRALHTWCAFDTVGIPAALGVEAVARSTCPTCGAEIVLDLPAGRPPASAVVGWWPEAPSGPVNEAFCPTASLFCNHEHLDTWRAAHSLEPGVVLSLPELAERGRLTWALFRDQGDRL